MTSEELMIYQEKRKALIKKHNIKLFKTLLPLILIGLAAVGLIIGIGYGILHNIPVTAVLALITFLFIFIMSLMKITVGLANKNKALYKFEEQEGLKRI